MSHDVSIDRILFWRRVARITATGSTMLFLIAMIVMVRWIFRFQNAGSPGSPALPNAFDATMPLICLTAASFTFPIVLISVITLMRVPDSKDEPEASMPLD